MAGQLYAGQSSGAGPVPLPPYSSSSQRDEQAGEARGMDVTHVSSEQVREPLTKIGRDIRLTKRMLQHATRLALASTEKQMETERWNLNQVEKAMQEKKRVEEGNTDASDPEEFMRRERGWWDQELAEWKDKREAMRQELEKRALEQLLASQSHEQREELQDPRAAQQWLQLMESSLHPFICELQRSIAAPPPPRFTAPPDKVPVPDPGAWHAQETRSGLWSTVPKTTEEFVNTRRENLLKADWSSSFNKGTVGAHGEPEDKYWRPPSHKNRRLQGDASTFVTAYDKPKTADQRPNRSERSTFIVDSSFGCTAKAPSYSSGRTSFGW